MKKNVIAGVMLATAAIFGTSATFAQAPQKGDNTQKCNGEKCEHNKDKGQKPAFNPFEGLNLTAEQQSKIDALKEECKAQKSEFKKDAKAKKQQLKKDAKEGRANMKAEMLKKVKAILTPEQYVQFLENAFVNGNGDKGQRKQPMHGQKGEKKFDKRGEKGQKLQK